MLLRERTLGTARRASEKLSMRLDLELGVEEVDLLDLVLLEKGEQGFVTLSNYLCKLITMQNDFLLQTSSSITKFAASGQELRQISIRSSFRHGSRSGVWYELDPAISQTHRGRRYKGFLLPLQT